MKRFLSILIILTMVLCLVSSCGEQADDALNQVGGQTGNNISTDRPADENMENSSQGDLQNQAPQGNSPGQNSQGNSQQPSDDPDAPVSSPAEDAEDPYAAMKADQSGTKLKIMCQNLRYDAVDDQGTDNDARIRRYRFQTLVEKYDPDIISGQECCSTWIQFLQEDYGSEYDMFYEYRGATSGSNEACPVLWKKDKYTKLNEGYFWLSDTPTVASPSFVGGYPRIVNWVSLKDKQTGQVFNIYSAHFSLDLEPEHLEKTRMIFSKYLSKLPRNTYAFVMGDFNISYQSEHYYMLTDDVVLADLRPLSEEMAKNGHCTLGDIRNGCFNGFENPNGGVFGDFILTLPRKNLAIDKFGYCYEMPGNPAKNVGEGYVSDHFAVYTEVRMGSKISYSDYFGDAAK